MPPPILDMTIMDNDEGPTPARRVDRNAARKQRRKALDDSLEVEEGKALFGVEKLFIELLHNILP